MYEDRLRSVRLRIKEAKEQEAHSHRLAKALKNTLSTLHTSIRLPEHQPESALLDFIVHYIEHVPDCVEALAQIAKRYGIEAFTDTLLNLCLDYFISPPDIINEHSGLLELLDEAYLAHRFMEEINDRMMILCGSPLTPMNMTNANLIVHGLIGEHFANQLDLAVYYSMEMVLLSEKQLAQPALTQYVREHQLHGWEKDIATWPCLAENLTIELSFAAN